MNSGSRHFSQPRSPRPVEKTPKKVDLSREDKCWRDEYRDGVAVRCVPVTRPQPSTASFVGDTYACLSG